jgi:hypothetical protein
MAPLSAMSIEKKEMLRVLHDEQEFAGKFISYMLERNLKTEADLVDQLFNSSEKRLARALLMLARYGKEGRPETMVAKISQETLAELVGTTRSRVNFFINKFRKLGFIHYNGGLQVHSSLLNVVPHELSSYSDFRRGTKLSHGPMFSVALLTRAPPYSRAASHARHKHAMQTLLPRGLPQSCGIQRLSGLCEGEFQESGRRIDCIRSQLARVQTPQREACSSPP